MSLIVQFQNIYKEFRSKPLLENVNFEIRKGELTTLIGPNGIGKTTVARMILGLELPTKGNIIIKKELKIGYVPQSIDFNSSFPLKAEKFLQILNPDYSNIYYQELMNFTSYEEIKSIPISLLSGGQFRKLLLAATLLTGAEFVVLDEPTLSLDLASTKEFYNLIDEIKTKLNITFFMISHDLYKVMKNSDYVICLNNKTHCSGKPTDLSKNSDFLNNISTFGFYHHTHDN